MKSKLRIVCLIIGLLFGWGTVAQVQCEDLEWTAKTELNLQASPLDVATSSDGRWIFVLVPGKVVVYPSSKSQPVKEIPVDAQFDRLAHSPQDNTLVLSSSSGNRLKFIALELVYAFDVSGLPFKGPEKAPVTLAVFGDYQ